MLSFANASDIYTVSEKKLCIFVSVRTSSNFHYFNKF